MTPNLRKEIRFNSPHRLKPYRKAVGRRVPAKTLWELYDLNLSLSKSMWPLVAGMEIGLRNSVNHHLGKTWSSDDWLVEQLGGFFINPNTNFVYMSKKIKKGIARLNYQGEEISNSTLIECLEFGFWASFFDKRQLYILKNSHNIDLLECFPGLRDKSINPKIVSDRIKRIRQFRNRIAHHEPIIFDRNGKLSMYYPELLLKDLLILKGWISNQSISKERLEEPEYHMRQLSKKIRSQNRWIFKLRYKKLLP